MASRSACGGGLQGAEHLRARAWLLPLGVRRRSERHDLRVHRGSCGRREDQRHAHQGCACGAQALARRAITSPTTLIDEGQHRRILTTHVGSLPRSQAVTDVLFAREKGELPRPARRPRRSSREAVAEVVRRQVEAGIDVVSDGEMSKISYATYIGDRFTGFGGDTPREPGQDLIEFPALLRSSPQRRDGEVPAAALHRPDRGEGPGPLDEDLGNFARRWPRRSPPKRS